MLRSLMLKAADRPFWTRPFAAIGKRSGLADRFVAGESEESALRVAARLNRGGMRVSLDLLGEGVTEPGEARRATTAYVHLLEAIHSKGLESGISIKLTHLGLSFDREQCRQNLTTILEQAQRRDNFVRIDMEGSRWTQDTIDLFREGYERFRHHVGIVIQSYLYRSQADIRELTALGCSIRLCKGAYQEPPEIAFPEKKDVDGNYIELLEMLLGSSSFTAIASHDHRIIEQARQMIIDKGVSPDRYEFQMLFGVRRDYQVKLIEEGCNLRIYVPFGTHWAPYFMRRLAERPSNLLFAARSMVGG